jgi:hypothetical protein
MSSRSPSSGNHRPNAATTLALFVGPIIYLTWKHRRLARERERYWEERVAERGEGERDYYESGMGGGEEGGDYLERRPLRQHFHDV